MRRNSICIVILLLLISCGEEVIPKPANLIPQDKMADIIQEMAVVNAAKSSNPAVFNQYEIEPTDFIFKKYEVDSLQFVASDRYYISRPDQYKNIYKIIEKRIETKAKEMTKAKNEKDSIARLEKVKKAKERSGKKRANKNAPQ